MSTSFRLVRCGLHHRFKRASSVTPALALSTTGNLRNISTIIDTPSDGTRRDRSSAGTAKSRQPGEEPSFTPPANAKSWDLLKRKQLQPLYDCFHRSPQDALDKSLQTYLPQYRHEEKRLMRPGNHLIYFPPLVTEKFLLPDGTDLVHAPDSSWSYRLWAGGSIEFHKGAYFPLERQRGLLAESIHSVRSVGDPDKPEKIFVEISRRMYMNGKPRLTEIRNLCFMQQMPNSLKDTKRTRSLKPPTEALMKVRMQASKALLFRFSALTFNAHAIHINPEFTKEVYGLPNLLVHGPLQLTLMLEVLQRALRRESHKQMHIKNIDYKNLSPLFVEEEFAICCKRIKSKTEEDGMLKEDWQVWIEAGQGDEVALIAKGTAICVDDPSLLDEDTQPFVRKIKTASMITRHQTRPKTTENQGEIPRAQPILETKPAEMNGSDVDKT